MEKIIAFLAVGAIGCSLGFITAFLIEFLLPIIHINISKKEDSAFIVALIAILSFRIFIGSGFGIGFMVIIGLMTFIAYHLFLILLKK